MVTRSKKTKVNSERPDSQLSPNELIEKHSEYVIAVVGKLVSQLRLPADEFDELLSAGYMGLVESAQRFSSKHNSAFRSYSFLRIRGSVLDHIRKMSAIDHVIYKKLKAMDALHEIEGQFVTEQIAENPDDPIASLGQVLDFASDAILADQLLEDSESGGVDSLVDRTQSYEQDLEEANAKLALQRALETLSDKQRSLIEGVYFRDKSFKQMGRSLGRLGKSTVSKLHTKTIKHLKFAYLRELGKLNAIKEGNSKSRG